MNPRSSNFRSEYAENNEDQHDSRDDSHFDYSKSPPVVHEKTFSNSIAGSMLRFLPVIVIYAAVILIVVFVRISNTDYTPAGNQYLFERDTSIKTEMTPPSVNVSSFRADVAYEHLRYLARTPHPWNTAANQDNLDYLTMVLTEIQNLAKSVGVTMEIVSEDPTVFTTTSTVAGFSKSLSKNSTVSPSIYLEGRNVLARIIGTDNDANNAILISSHIDSVQVSPGATDDGINGAVMLEMARHIVFNRLKATVVFNFNNGEEIGLFGALAFMHHGWASTIKAFINIEGAGAGGSAMVFRSSNYDVVKHYSHHNSKFTDKWRPHANVFANDAFKLGLINSDTDYTVYAAYGIPGLDIAFYQKRSLYHTTHDSIANVPMGSIDQVGNSVLNTVKSMSEDAAFLKKPRGITDGDSIYYDFLGRTVIAHSVRVMYVIYISMLILIPLISFGIKFISVRKFRTLVHSNSHHPARNLSINIPISTLVKAMAFSSLAIIMSLVFSFIIGLILNKANPFIVYSNYYLVTATHALGNVFAINLVLNTWMTLETRKKSSFPLFSHKLASRVLTYSQVFIWWFGMLIAMILLIAKGAGLMYYTAYYAGFGFVAALLCRFVEAKEFQNHTASFTTWFVRMVVAIFVPSLFSVDLTGILINGLGQTVIDGTGPVMVNLLIGLLTTTILVPSIPFFALPGKNMRWSALFTFIIFLGLLIATIVIKPFSATAPSHVYSLSDLNMQTKSENTTIQGNVKFDTELFNLINTNYPDTKISSKKNPDYFPELYAATWIGDNGFASSFEKSNTDLPSYSVSRNIPSQFRGSLENSTNGMFITITAPKAYICELVTEKLPVYMYTVPQSAYGEINATVSQESSGQSSTIFPAKNKKFDSFDYTDAPKYYGQSLFMLTKNPDSKWVVYLEPDSLGIGEVTLQCHYGEISLLMPQVVLIQKYVEDHSKVMGSLHSAYGVMTVTTDIIL